VVFSDDVVSNLLPDPGETLVLFLDQPVSPNPGAALDDLDFALPANAMLGPGALGLSMAGAWSVVVTLGSDPTFVPGTTTLDIAAEHDAILSSVGGMTAQPSMPRVIVTGDGDDPVINSLTLNAVPALLNGTGPAGGVLQCPPNGFTIDVAHSDGSSSIDTGRTHLVLDRDAMVSGISIPSGSSIAPHLQLVTTSTNSSHYLIPPSVVLPTGPLMLTAVVFDTSGHGSAPVSFPFRVASPTAARRPFEQGVNPQQLWVIDLTRDLDVITASGSTTITVSATATPNGRSDFEEVLQVLGLWSPTPLSSVLGTQDSNAVVLDLFKDELLLQIGLLFDDVNVAFGFDGWSAALPSVQVPYEAAPASRICLTGRSDIGAVGYALLDPNNANQEDNCAHPGSSPSFGSRLGVFLHSLLVSPVSGLNGSVGGLFRITYDGLIPGRGIPIGLDPADGTRLANIVGGQAGDGRQTTIEHAIDRLARFAAVTLAHECGHSMGLVTDGPMPGGLYGGDSVNFPGSTTAHIKLGPATGIFPNGAQEVMQPTIGFHACQHPDTGFNPLEMAYLRERVLCDDQ